jgi:hypothetical protein
MSNLWIQGAGRLRCGRSRCGGSRASEILCRSASVPRGSLQIPPGVVSQIPPPARQDKGLLV